MEACQRFFPSRIDRNWLRFIFFTKNASSKLNDNRDKKISIANLLKVMLWVDVVVSGSHCTYSMLRGEERNVAQYVLCAL